MPRWPTVLGQAMRRLAPALGFLEVDLATLITFRMEGHLDAAGVEIGA